MNKSCRFFLSAIVLPAGFTFAQSLPVNAAAKLKTYPFAQAASALQGSVPPLSVQGFNPSTISGAPKQATGKLFAGTPVPISHAGQEALSIAHDWQAGDPVLTTGENGRVQFTYGAAMPPVIVGPARETLIFLQPGEHLTEQPIFGDSSRWEALVLKVGEGENERTVVSVKFKKEGNYQTDLVLATNRRVYQLNLQTNPTRFLSQVEFTYPNDPTENWKQYQAEVQKEQADEEQRRQKQAHLATLNGPANYDYTVKVKRHHQPPFTPKTVFDDGKQTFFVLPSQAQNWDAAVLQVAGPNGCEIVDYRPVPNDPKMLKVDRLFNQAELVSGTGKHAERVIIERDGFDGKLHCGKIKHSIQLASAEKR